MVDFNLAQIKINKKQKQKQKYIKHRLCQGYATLFKWAPHPPLTAEH